MGESLASDAQGPTAWRVAECLARGAALRLGPVGQSPPQSIRTGGSAHQRAAREALWGGGVGAANRQTFWDGFDDETAAAAHGFLRNDSRHFVSSLLLPANS